MNERPTSCGNCHYRHPDDRAWNKPVRCAYFNKVFPEWQMDCSGWVTQALAVFQEKRRAVGETEHLRQRIAELEEALKDVPQMVFFLSVREKEMRDLLGNKHWEAIYEIGRRAASILSQSVPDAPADGDDVAKALATFSEYFRKNYPGPDTIIHNPDWHAPRIFRAALAAMPRPAIDRG